jgi:hypothetical protein
MDQGNVHMMPTRDHTIPRCKGGHRSPKVICCRICNNLKGDMLPAEWDAYMAANPGWWLLTKAQRRAINALARDKKRVDKWGARLKRRELLYPSKARESCHATSPPILRTG